MSLRPPQQQAPLITSIPAGVSAKSMVRFHDPNDPQYGAFSVLSPHPVTIRHVTYPSVHHFFLCERFKGSGVEQEILKASSLWEVDRQVRKGEIAGLQLENWDAIKVDVMLLGNYYKFRQNPNAMHILLGTHQKLLIDSTPADHFWGDGGDGTGKNLLGTILQAVRKRLHATVAAEERVARKKAAQDAVKGGSGVGANAGNAGGGSSAVPAIAVSTR